MSGNLDQAIMNRATEAFYAAHNVAFAIIAKDLRIVDASVTFSTYFAGDNDHVQDRLLTDLMYEFVGAEDALRRIMASEEDRFQLDQVSRLSPAGMARYFSIFVQPLWPEQPEEGLLLLVEDITQLGQLQQQILQERNELRLVRRKLDRANQELVQLNKMKSLFLSMAAHDLRTPLTAIFGYADLLLEFTDNRNELDQEALTTIRHQAERMHRLIDDLLSLDQIEQDRLLITPTVCELNESIDEVLHSLAFKISHERLNLQVSLPQPPLQLWVDSGKWMQILYNLLFNAAKYTPPGGQIHIRAYADRPDVVLEIHNSGPGLQGKEWEELFTLYYRTESARRSNNSGTGLGLFIVKTLVEAQRGQIEVRNDQTEGVTFVVRLPLAGPLEDK